MKTFPMEHELTVPAWRWPRIARCPNPGCRAEVRVPGEHCATCTKEQWQERARVRALKSHRRSA